MRKSSKDDLVFFASLLKIRIMTFLAIRKIIVAKTKIEKDNSNNVKFFDHKSEMP
jgi:hypothetical protein|tara:strand:- start:928 stop:1092 length:165 start_codon:yes stop_codon:yes gene_type:complete